MQATAENGRPLSYHMKNWQSRLKISYTACTDTYMYSVNCNIVKIQYILNQCTPLLKYMYLNNTGPRLCFVKQTHTSNCVGQDCKCTSIYVYKWYIHTFTNIWPDILTVLWYHLQGKAVGVISQNCVSAHILVNRTNLCPSCTLLRLVFMNILNIITRNAVSFLFHFPSGDMIFLCAVMCGQLSGRMHNGKFVWLLGDT